MIIAAFGEIPLELISIILLVSISLINISLSRSGAKVSWLSQIVLGIVLLSFILEQSNILLILLTALLLAWLIYKIKKKYKYLNGFSTLILIAVLLIYLMTSTNNVLLIFFYWFLLCFDFAIMMGNKYVFDLLLISNTTLLIMILSATFFSGSTLLNEVVLHDYGLMQSMMLLFFLVFTLFGLISGLLMAFLTKRAVNYYFMENLLKKLDRSKKQASVMHLINDFFEKIHQQTIDLFFSFSKITNLNDFFEKFHSSMVSVFFSLSDVSKIFEQSINNTTNYTAYTVFGIGETAVSWQKNTINRDVLFIMIGMLLLLAGGLLL